jgi:hypothetical protein
LTDLWTPAAWPAESSTRTTNVNPPAVVGVPDSFPPVENARPLGRDPEPTDQWYGGVPPAAPIVTGVYPTPTSPACKEKLVIINFVGAVDGEDEGDELGVVLGGDSVLPPVELLGDVADDGLVWVDGLA